MELPLHVGVVTTSDNRTPGRWRAPLSVPQQRRGCLGQCQGFWVKL